MKDYLIARLKEKSTWYCCLSMLSAFGLVALTPEQNAAINALIGVIAGAGAAGMATPDNK